MRKYVLKDTLNAIKDAWFYGENILLMPWYNNQIIVYSDECLEVATMLKTYPGYKMNVSNIQFETGENFIEHLIDELKSFICIMEQDLNSQSREEYLYLKQTLFALKERIGIEEVLAPIEIQERVEILVEDLVENVDAVDVIFCDYHKERDITFKDHVIINFSGSDGDDYHFCDASCAKRFLLSRTNLIEDVKF